MESCVHFYVFYDNGFLSMNRELKERNKNECKEWCGIYDKTKLNIETSKTRFEKSEARTILFLKHLIFGL